MSWSTTGVAMSTLHTPSLSGGLQGGCCPYRQLCAHLLALPASLPHFVFKYSSLLFLPPPFHPPLMESSIFIGLMCLFQAFLYPERAPGAILADGHSVTVTPQHSVTQSHRRNCLMSPALAWGVISDCTHDYLEHLFCAPGSPGWLPGHAAWPGFLPSCSCSRLLERQIKSQLHSSRSTVVPRSPCACVSPP